MARQDSTGPLFSRRVKIQKRRDIDLAIVLHRAVMTFRIEVITQNDWPQYEAQFDALEKATYEPGRQDSTAFMRSWLEQPDGLVLVIKDLHDDKNQVFGYAIGGPLEHSQADGPKQDSMRGKHNTFYSTNILIAPRLRGKGFGLKLKQAQLKYVRAMTRADGSPRYDFMVGRNRVGYTPEIRRINRALGAYTVQVYDGQYGEPGGQALYYRIPLRRPYILMQKKPSSNIIDWSSSIQAPLGNHASELIHDVEQGRLTSAIGTKLTLSNWVTPDIVRYAELLQQLAPAACPHTYFTSGRDEVVDKGLRCLRVTRPQADIVIGLTGQYVGHTTAAARSLSAPIGDERNFGWFNWPLVEHDIESIKKTVLSYQPEQILGIVIELIGERSGHVIQANLLKGLHELRERTQIPLIFVETASGLGKNGQSLFMSDSLPVKPNMVWWYTGAQLGHVFVDDKYYVGKPLTLISTWDGDEISIRRTYRHLTVARESLKRGVAKQFELACRDFISMPLSGQGLWQSIRTQNATQLIERAAEVGLHLARGYEHQVLLCPPLSVSNSEIEQGLRRLHQVIHELS